MRRLLTILAIFLSIPLSAQQLMEEDKNTIRQYMDSQGYMRIENEWETTDLFIGDEKEILVTYRYNRVSSVTYSLPLKYMRKKIREYNRKYEKVENRSTWVNGRYKLSISAGKKMYITISRIR